MWSEASGTKGLGAFYITGEDSEATKDYQNIQLTAVPEPSPGAASSIALPHYITKTTEHINTKEMQAIEQALLHWGKRWRGCSVSIHTDYCAVGYGITNRTICEGSMDVLRCCLLLAAEYDLEIDVNWISTHENTLADALSRFDFLKIADIAP